MPAIAAGIAGIASVALLMWRPVVALGFAGGVITGAGMLSALVYVLNRAIVPPEDRGGRVWPLFLLHVAKFGLAAVFAYLVIIVLKGDVVAFAGGYTVALITLLICLGRRGYDMHTGGPTWD